MIRWKHNSTQEIQAFFLSKERPRVQEFVSQRKRLCTHYIYDLLTDGMGQQSLRKSISLILIVCLLQTTLSDAILWTICILSSCSIVISGTLLQRTFHKKNWQFVFDFDQLIRKNVFRVRPTINFGDILYIYKDGVRMLSKKIYIILHKRSFVKK